MTTAPPGEMIYGPFTDYQLVTTDHGVYGVRQGYVMWLEPRTILEGGQEIEVMMPVYEEVVPDPGPLPYSKIDPPTNRTPYLGNWERGTPYVAEGQDAPQESALLAKLTEAVTLLVAQQTGQTMTPVQAEVSAMTLINQAKDPELITEAVEALTVEETDDGSEGEDDGSD